MTDQLAEDVAALELAVARGVSIGQTEGYYGNIRRVIEALSTSQARERVLREAVEVYAAIPDTADLSLGYPARTALARVGGMK